MFPGKLAEAKSKGVTPKVAPEAADDGDSEAAPGNDDGTKDPALDPERDESLNILNDLVDLSKGPKTASVHP
jgi:hypothetical protein